MKQRLTTWFCFLAWYVPFHQGVYPSSVVLYPFKMEYTSTGCIISQHEMHHLTMICALSEWLICPLSMVHTLSTWWILFQHGEYSSHLLKMECTLSTLCCVFKWYVWSHHVYAMVTCACALSTLCIPSQHGIYCLTVSLSAIMWLTRPCNPFSYILDNWKVSTNSMSSNWTDK